MFDLGRMADAADTPTASAVDLAEWLVERGTPFREAHAIVGAIVRDSLERHVPMAELVEAHPALGHDAVALLGIGVAVTRRQTAGGTGPDQVTEQRKRFADRLTVDKQRVTSCFRKIGPIQLDGALAGVPYSRRPAPPCLRARRSGRGSAP